MLSVYIEEFAIILEDETRPPLNRFIVARGTKYEKTKPSVHL